MTNEIGTKEAHSARGPWVTGHPLKARPSPRALRIGWRLKRTVGSHRLLERSGWPDFTFAFHDKVEVGPKMLVRIAKHTGLRPEDL